MSRKLDYDPTKPLPPEGAPLPPQQLADHLHGRYKACRAPIDQAIKSGIIPAVRIGRKLYIPRRIASEILNNGRIPQAAG
jgi:hypothetical protein